MYNNRYDPAMEMDLHSIEVSLNVVTTGISP